MICHKVIASLALRPPNRTRQPLHSCQRCEVSLLDLLPKATGSNVSSIMVLLHITADEGTHVSFGNALIDVGKPAIDLIRLSTRALVCRVFANDGSC